MRLLLILIPFIVAFKPFDTPKGLVKDGNSLFSEEKFDEAIERYDQALEIVKDKAPINYNRGNVLLKKGDMEGAISEYRKGTAYGDASLKAKSLYNMGNAFYKGERYGEAAELYRDALRQNPSDVDTKINLEMALKKMEESKKENDKDKDNGEGEDKGSEKKKNDISKGKDRSGSDKSESEKKENLDEESSDSKDIGENKMSREDAERLLESLGDNNMDLQNMADMVKSAGPEKVEKDW